MYRLTLGAYTLRAYLDPAAGAVPGPGDLGAPEHPFAWRFEVEHAEDGLEFRGVRESLAEAQQAAEGKVRSLAPDDLAWAVGY